MGSGQPRREFLHVDDMARACIKVMEVDHNIYDNNTYETCSHINVGTGIDITIKGLAEKIKKIIEYTGTIEFDTNKPDGVARKLIDNQRIKKLGWSPLVNLEDGLLKTYQDFKRL